MKLYMSEDEKYPHVFAETEEQVRIKDAERAHTYRTWHRAEMPATFYRSDRDVRNVPDHLGEELVALRKREEELLDEIERHIRETGQKPVQEDWGL